MQVHRTHRLHITFELARQILGVPQARDPVVVLARLLRPRMHEVVARDTRVRVEIEKSFFFRAHRGEQPRQQRVLEYVREITGVKEVAIRKHAWVVRQAVESAPRMRTGTVYPLPSP